MDFICFSINAWEKRRARKQQFMWHLSLRADVGKVIYVEPPLNIWRLILLPFAELSNPENRKRWRRALTLCYERLSDKFFVFTPIYFIPFAFRFKFIYNINLYFLYLRISRLACESKMRDVVVWLYHPFDLPLLNWFKNIKLTCFDWAEEWAEYFTEYSSSRLDAIRRMEEDIVSRVGLVFVVSKKLLEPARALNMNSYQVLDGTVPELFSKNYDQAPQDLKDIRHPIVGYIGTVSFRIDTELVMNLSQRMPQVSFVFIGDIHADRVDIGLLRQRPNLFFLQGKPYDELARYAAFFDVCFLPYKPLPFTSPPTKIFDYLACGKPVVSTVLPELKFLEGLIYEAKSAGEFEAAIKKALQENSSEQSLRRKEKAKDNSWEKRAEEIIGLINETLNRKKV